MTCLYRRYQHHFGISSTLTRFSRLTTPGKPTCCSCLKPSGWPILFFEIPLKLVCFEFLLSFAPGPATATLPSPLTPSVLFRPPSFELIWRESRRPAVRIRPAAEFWPWLPLPCAASGKSITASRGTPTHKRLRIMVAILNSENNTWCWWENRPRYGVARRNWSEWRPEGIEGEERRRG